jgi:hypothetical protein
MLLVLTATVFCGGCSSEGRQGGIALNPAGSGQQSTGDSRTTGEFEAGTPPGGDSPDGGGGGLDYPTPGPEAGPLEPQSLIDYDQGSIGPWGPVIDQQHVFLQGQEYIVNRLSSPDPFTPTWQMPDGEIVVSNTPLQVLMQPGYVPLDPPIVEWTEPQSGDTMHLYDGQILVYFKPTTTQLQIEQFIAQLGLNVVMSWFEPPDEPEQGNSIAWFQFEYPSQLFPTFGQAYAFFNAHPLVDFARPNTTDELEGCYCDAQGNPVAWPTDLAADPNHFFPGMCKTIQAYHVHDTTFVRLGPEAGAAGNDFSPEVVAVLDDGVLRSHKDFKTGLGEDPPEPPPGGDLGYKGKISWVGVSCTNDAYYVGDKWHLRGEPEFYNPYRSGLTCHGTMMAGMISAGTLNPSAGTRPLGLGTGTASLAPTALILPVRMRVTGALDQVAPIYSSGAFVTGIRAVRFEFGHTKWIQKVRVVNMSFAGNKGPWWPKGDMKYNIGRDLIFNDRLYVGAAGNDGQRVLKYPAAHDNVLGVTGGTATFLGAGQWGFTADPGSNYWDLAWPQENSAYPVSGIYGFTQPEVGGPYTQWLPRPEGAGVPVDGAQYGSCGGTSEATAQVSALAFLLYDKKARQTGNPLACSRYLVKHQIVHTSGSTMMYQGDPNHVLGGVVSFWEALRYW